MKLSMFLKKPAKKVFFKKKEEPKIQSTLRFINKLDNPRYTETCCKNYFKTI